MVKVEDEPTDVGSWDIDQGVSSVWMTTHILIS